MLETLQEHFHRFGDGRCDVILIRKLGVAVCQLAASGSPCFMEREAKLAVRQSMEACAEELNRKLG